LEIWMKPTMICWFAKKRSWRWKTILVSCLLSQRDLIDVWFDSYSTYNILENYKLTQIFSWDFIAEGVDQTWMVLYATCDCDFSFLIKWPIKKCSFLGLVLDKNGQKNQLKCFHADLEIILFPLMPPEPFHKLCTPFMKGPWDTFGVNPSLNPSQPRRLCFKPCSTHLSYKQYSWMILTW
jgi:hypothetical protein